MSYIRDFLGGMVSVLAFTAPPLYRYPYRNSADAFRGDWKRIGQDVEYLFDKEIKTGNYAND